MPPPARAVHVRPACRGARSAAPTSGPQRRDARAPARRRDRGLRRAGLRRTHDDRGLPPRRCSRRARCSSISRRKAGLVGATAEHLFAALIDDFRAAFAEAAAADGRPRRGARQLWCARSANAACTPRSSSRAPRVRIRSWRPPRARARPPWREPAREARALFPRAAAASNPDFDAIVDRRAPRSRAPRWGRRRTRGPRGGAPRLAHGLARDRLPTRAGGPARVSDLIQLAMPVFFALIAFEAARQARAAAGCAARYATRATPWRASRSALGNVLVAAAAKASLSRSSSAPTPHRLFDLGTGPWVLLLALLRRRLRLLLVPPRPPRGPPLLGGARQAPLEPALQSLDRAAPVRGQPITGSALLAAARAARLPPGDDPDGAGRRA